jgi:hypothetical protein
MQAASGKTVLTGGTGVVVAPIIIWVLSLFGIEMPPEVAAGIAGLLALAVAYFVPAKSGKYVAVNEDLDNADTLVNRHDVDPNEFEEGVA